MARFMSVISALMVVLVFASAGYAGKCEVNKPAEPVYVPPAEESARAADAAYAKGLRALMEKRFDDAVVNFEETIKHDPNSYNTRLTLANVYRIQKKDGEAERVYREAIIARPKAAGAYDSLMVLLTDQGRGKEAVETGEAARAEGIDDKPLTALGWSYYVAGDLEKAKACFDRNLTYRPGDYLANRDMGVYLLEKGDAAAALKYFEDAEKAGPRQGVTAYLRATAYRQLGDEPNTYVLVKEMVLFDKGDKFNTGKYARQVLPHSEPPDFRKYLFSLRDDALHNKGGEAGDGGGSPAGPVE